MSHVITVDLRIAVPIDEQIRTRIRELVALGKLTDGQPLPSARQLAGELGVHFTTVARAYRRLQLEGLLTVGQGRGVFVREAGSRPRATAAERDSLRSRLRDLLADARLSGLSVVQTRELLLAELDRFTRQEKR